MRELYIKSQIHKFKSFGDFAKEFNLSSSDLIFTEQFLFDTFIKQLILPCEVLLRDPYGMGEPSDEMIDKINTDAVKFDFKRVIAIGGGSVIDIAKIIALNDSIPSADLFKKLKPVKREKQLVIIPTTCGTGSEMTNLSIAHIVEKETKMGLGNDEMYADHAVLIPELVEGLPYKFFICSAIDALVHAAESYVSPKANAFTRMMSEKACEIILDGFGRMIKEGQEIRKELSADFLFASCMGGIAFGNAGVGPVHALAYPLGGVYHVAHGESNYQFFTGVFNLYMKNKVDARIDDLGSLIESKLNKVEIKSGGGDVFVRLEEMLQRLLPLKKLREYGMKEEEIEVFSQNVMDNQQRLLVNSYIPFKKEYAVNIYKDRF